MSSESNSVVEQTDALVVGEFTKPFTRRNEKLEEKKRTSVISAYIELTKPRILVLIILTAMAGFGMAVEGEVDKLLILNMSIGVMLIAAGTATLNQFFERNLDLLMKRTALRPLPSGRLSPEKARNFGIVTSIIGTLYLALFVNPLTSLLGLLTIISYLFLYTPLKTRSPLSTLVGAFPGAMPPMLGWAAARGEVGLEAFVLFAIMFLWQFPHFLAIAWMYKDDYARAGICMLPIVDKEGVMTGRQIVLYALALVPVSLMPTMIGLTGSLYFFVAFVLSLGYLYFSINAARLRTGLQAKRLLQASIVYPPLLFIFMLLNW